jgi:FdhD protein
MKDAFDYEGYKFEKGSVTKVTDPLTVEAPLQISINNESFTVVMQTPGAEKELVTGLLYAEKVILDFSKVKWEFKLSEAQFIETVNLTTDKSNIGDGFLNSRSLLSVSSCGICGKKEIGELRPAGNSLSSDFSISFEAIDSLFVQMANQQDLFKLTGGCHGIAAFDKDLKLMCLFEDVGRHNALDKVIGSLILENKLDQAKVLTFSGRTSYEMVFKAFRAKIPIIAAVSAPTTFAVELAKEFGISLLSFCRNGKSTAYSSPNRLRTPTA